MGRVFYIGYLEYVIVLLVITGGAIIAVDSRRYKKSGMVKERKAAKLIGWLNISLGVLVLAANWVYRQWFFF